MYIFAVPYITKSGSTAFNTGADFLYPFGNCIGYSTPSRSLNGFAALCECKAEGKAVPSFCIQPQHNLLSVMPYSEKNCKSEKYSTQHATPTERNTVSYDEFLIELNAKNRAYAFILHHNLLDSYRKFCLEHEGQDPHKLCLTLLTKRV